MSTLRRQEPAGAGLKRIACDQVESAIRSLTRQAGQADAAAKAIAQARAVMALIEPELPRAALRRDRAILDRLSDGLAELTGPEALGKQLNRTYKKAPRDKALAAAVKTLRKRWVKGNRSTAMSSKAGSFNPIIYRLVADMAELRGHVGGWVVTEVPNDQVPRGLRRTYTRARRLASEPISPEGLPTLMQALEDLATQLGVVSKACPTMLKAHRKLVIRSTNALADLSRRQALHAALRTELGRGSTKALPNLKPLATRTAECLGGDLDAALAETPAALMKRVQAYWSAWRT